MDGFFSLIRDRTAWFDDPLLGPEGLGFQNLCISDTEGQSLILMRGVWCGSFAVYCLLPYNKDVKNTREQLYCPYMITKGGEVET